MRLIARADGHITQCEHPCAKGGGKLCITAIGPMGAKPSWEWCGNPVLPTLKPSISCLSCGWHGFIRNGQMVDPTPEEWRATQPPPKDNQ